jgi:hypothetical protein
MKAEDMISIAELGSDPLGREEFIRFIADYWMNILTKKYPAKNGKTLRWI